MARKDKSDAAIEREQEERATKALVRYEKKAYDRKQLHLDIQNLTKRTMDWLQEGGRYEELLEESKIRDIAVMMGILTDKTLLLEGQPTQIIGMPQQAQLDQLGQTLQAALQQRGLTKQVQLTERTATIELKPNEP